jgi:prefoldin alpha subunit
MNEKEAREAYFELKLIEEQISQLQNQITRLEQNIEEFESAAKSLEELKGKSGEEAFVPVSAGIYAKARLEGTEQFIVSVGAGVAVEKSGQETKKLLEKQLAGMRNYREQMVKGLQLLASRAGEIEEAVSKE